jgi:hypothetical protein
MQDSAAEQEARLTLTGIVSYEPVTLTGEVDYEMSDEAPSCWIGVDGLSVYIYRTAKGVSVEVFKKGCEDDPPLDAIFVPQVDP